MGQLNLVNSFSNLGKLKLSTIQKFISVPNYQFLFPFKHLSLSRLLFVSARINFLLCRAAPDIRFDDVDEIFIEKPKQTVEGEKPKVKLNPLVRPNSFEGYVSFMLCFY